MGTWGYGLFSDDTANDIRGLYRDYLLEGLSGPAATDRLLGEFAQNALDADNDGAVFWLALAVTQWELGRLEDRVKERALRVIAAGQGLDFWMHEGGPNSAKQRAAVYARVQAKLSAPQRKPVKVRPPPPRKYEPGAVLEIPTPKGLAYAQYTHDVPDHGDLITVYEGLYATRPDPIELATRAPVQIKLITLLDHGLRHKMMALAGSAPIPEHSQVFPVFRNRPPWSDRWGFWDGKRKWQADWDDLDDAELRDLPDLTIHGPDLAKKIVQKMRLADSLSLDPTWDGHSRALALGRPDPASLVPSRELVFDWGRAFGDPPSAVSLKRQLAELERIGIRPRPDVTRKLIAGWRDESGYEHHPYVALLAELGREEPGGGRRSADVCLVDNAGVDGPRASVQLVERMRDLAGEALPLTDVSGGVDHVAFTLDGARRHWDLAVDAPWVDRTVFSRLVSLLRERGIERRYIYLGLGVRYFVTACLTPQALRMLRALGGRRILWLE